MFVLLGKFQSNFFFQELNEALTKDQSHVAQVCNVAQTTLNLIVDSLLRKVIL